MRPAIAKQHGAWTLQDNKDKTNYHAHTECGWMGAYPIGNAQRVYGIKASIPCVYNMPTTSYTWSTVCTCPYIQLVLTIVQLYFVRRTACGKIHIYLVQVARLLGTWELRRCQAMTAETWRHYILA